VIDGGQAIRVRPAQPGDAPDLAGIDLEVNVSPWSITQFEAVCAGVDGARERALVVEEAGLPVGFVVFTRVLDEACIHNIAVRLSRQRRGLGAVLLEGAMRELRREGIARCLLELRVSNGAARALYERFAFQVDGVRKDYYPAVAGREDALLMSTML